MITTNGQLYQWDTGRVIEVFPLSGHKVSEIQVYNGTTPYVIVLEVAHTVGNKCFAKIPDVLLQSDNNMDIYVMTIDSFGERTTEHKNVTVLSKQRPQDYVYNELDVKTWYALERRIETLEKVSVLTERQDLTDEQKSQARENIGVSQTDVLSDDDLLSWLNEANIVKPVVNASGEIYTSNNDEVYVL